MMWLTSAGRYLRRVYLNRRFAFTWLCPWAIYAILDFTCPWLQWWLIPIYVAVVMFFAWMWTLHSDWKEMYRIGLHVSEKTICIAAENPQHEIRYASLKMDRRFPRLLWVMVALDGDAIHMYQGWSLFVNRVPDPSRIMKSHVYRQVA